MKYRPVEYCRIKVLKNFKANKPFPLENETDFLKSHPPSIRSLGGISIAVKK